MGLKLAIGHAPDQVNASRASRASRAPSSDVPKPPCPWCGSQASRVYRSKGALRSDEHRRRRRCDDCHRTWPTVEGLDKVRFLRELEAAHVDPHDLGLADVPLRRTG